MMTQHNDWSAMQQSSYHDMQVDSLGAFSARNPLDSLAVTAPGRTRCVNAENPTGGKGTAATAASALGPSRKGSPCIQTVKAGESVTLMNVDGPGVIRHIWMTVTDRTSPTGPNVLRNLILEFYLGWRGNPVSAMPDRRLLLLRPRAGLPSQFDAGGGRTQSRFQLLFLHAVRTCAHRAPQRSQ